MCRLLIVEDDYIIALSTEKMAQKLGCEVVGVVTSGEEAIKVAEKERPDIVFMDIRLAGELDGIDTCSEILNKMPDIEVVYITGNADRAYREKANKTNFKAFLIKPVRMDDLRRIIGNNVYKN